MSIFIMQNSSEPFQSFRTRLDGVDYLISLAYNQREDRWYLSLADDEEKPLISGIKLVANWPLLRKHRYDTSIPPGEFMAFCSAADRSPPGFGELGLNKRCQLMYLDAAGLAALNPAPTIVIISVPLYLTVKITVASMYSGDPGFVDAFTTALANSCNNHFGVGSTVSAAAVAPLAGPYGVITGCDVGQVPLPFGPTSVAGTVIQMQPNWRPEFDRTRINVVAV